MKKTTEQEKQNEIGIDARQTAIKAVDRELSRQGLDPEKIAINQWPKFSALAWGLNGS